MTTIPLRTEVIRSYLGTVFNPCCEFSSIRCEPSNDPRATTIRVKAEIPAATTRSGIYIVSVIVDRDGSNITWSYCSCPQGGGVGGKCKHVYKVLCCIAQGPIAEPTPEEAPRLRHASVYIAIACRSELDSGSDLARSWLIKDNVDQEILGIFFSKKEANECAKEHLELEMDDDDDKEKDDNDDEVDGEEEDIKDDDDEEEDIKDDDDDDEDAEDGEEEDISVDSEDEETFVYDGSDHDVYDDRGMFLKVWVERRAIEDASRNFHKIDALSSSS
jgi:hypothetical protein